MRKEEILRTINEYYSNDKNDEKQTAFINAFTMFMEGKHPLTDCVDLAVSGIEIDYGSNFIDYFEDQKREPRELWKDISQSDLLQNNENDKGFKFLCALLLSALMEGKNSKDLLVQILAAMGGLKKTEAKLEDRALYVSQNVLADLSEVLKSLPDWDVMKMSDEKADYICKLFAKAAEIAEREKSAPKKVTYNIKLWVQKGSGKVSDNKAIRELEKNKPEKRSQELKALVEHYIGVEEALDKAVHEASRLTIENRHLNERIRDMEKKSREDGKTIEKYEAEIAEKRKDLEKLKNELEASIDITKSQTLYHENSQNAMLRDIADSLEMEYRDYLSSENEEMDVVLGEICRDKLRKVFKILEAKGIKVGN